MLWSGIGIATVREENHPLLVRAGYMRGSEYLFLGQRALAKIEATGRDLDRCGVRYTVAGSKLVVESASGPESGDAVLVRGTGYAALLAEAISVPSAPAVPDPEGDLAPEEFSTPGVKTITQITSFTGLPATSQLKSLVMSADGTLVLALLRGDHQLNPAKLPGARQATPEEIRHQFGADPGSIGPVGVPVGIKALRIMTDEALRGRRNMISGANKNDHHLRNVTPGEDFPAEFVDLRLAMEGDTCVTDGGPLKFERVTVLDTPESILRAAVEQNRDADGIVLPPAIAPFTVIVTPVHPDRLAAAREIYEKLQSDGIGVLLDDRDVRPGVKFKDADLIGIPYRINVGKKLAEGIVEVVERSPKQSTDVPVTQVPGWFSSRTPR